MPALSTALGPLRSPRLHCSYNLAYRLIIRSNLVSNAIKFTRTGSVTLTTELLHVTPEPTQDMASSQDTDVTKVDYGSPNRDVEKALQPEEGLEANEKRRPYEDVMGTGRKIVIRVEIQDEGPGLKKEDLIESV